MATVTANTLNFPRFSRMFLQIPSVALGLAVPGTVLADATVTYPQSANFDVFADWMVSFVDISEVSGVVQPLVTDEDDDASGLGFAEARAEIDESTDPSRAAGRAPDDMDSTALGTAWTEDTQQTSAGASGVFTGGIGERIAITSTASQEFTLEWTGEAVGSTTAVICLMPIRLAIFEGDELPAGINPATATYRYSLSIDGNAIYESGMRLSGTAGDQQLTTISGAPRTDGVFFSDPANNTFGVDFPAITVHAPMRGFDEFEQRFGEIEFSMAVEAPDANWGAQATPNDEGAVNAFIPIPEPALPTLVALGLAAMAMRRTRPAR